tara:strand:+ start:241 stop:666 length:426 start_codon:yes stop_codon:yes gene_type:complete
LPEESPKTSAVSNSKVIPYNELAAKIVNEGAARKDTEQSGAGISLGNFKLPFVKEKKDYLKGGWYESCSDLPITFDEIQVEKATFFDEAQGKLTPAQNMQSYIENYSVEFKLPAYYVKDAKFFPQDPTHMLQLSNYECVTD